MFDDCYDNYDDIDYYDEQERKIHLKIQRLIEKGIDPSRIRKDGTYVMTKDEFMKAITKHYNEKKKNERNKQGAYESDYMDYLAKIFQKRKKKLRRY